MRTQYEIDGLSKWAEEDVYAEGCIPETSTTFAVDCSFKDDTLEGLISKVCSFLDIEDRENVLLDSCNEEGRIDFQTLEGEEGYTATNEAIKKWKKGKLKLWACCYSCRVEKVTREVLSLV